jgi:uncharacterized protein (TIGR02145 family)
MKKIYSMGFRLPVYYIIFVILFFFCYASNVKAQDTACSQSPPPEHSKSLIPINGESDSPTLPSTACQNSDFSLGTFTNWSGCSGKWCADTLRTSTRCTGNYVPFNPPCNNSGQPWYNTPTGGHFSIQDSGQFDPCISTLRRVFPGDVHSALLGNRVCSNSNAGGYVDQLTYQIVYDPNNSFFIYRCAVVLANIQDPTHNTANRRPRFTFVILDHITGDTIDPVCGFYDLWPGDGITNWNETGSPLNFYWKDWSTIGLDFNALSGVTAGQLLDVVFTIHGCAFTAHTGYAYISAYCGSMTIQNSGCEGSGSITLTGPPGFTQYQWQGPYCPTCPPNPPTYTGNPITITAAQGAVTGNVFTLTVTALNGCQVQNVQQIIAFTSVTAGFTHGSACVGQGMQFNDQSTSNQNQITGWDWNFGDSSPIQHEKNPIHIYTAAGTYLVSLTAYSSDSCPNTTTDSVTVYPLPTPSFTTSENSVCLNIPGKVYTTQPNKLNYIWTIPPQATITAGGTNNDNSVTLTWNTIGVYSISVNYSDPNTLCTAASATPFTVTVNPLPVPSIGGPLTACAGSTGNIYTTLPGMTNYLWNVSAGGTITSGGSITDNTATVTWNTPGPQTVSLNYTDANTCTALAPTIYPVTVNALPFPVISGPAGMCLNTTGTYTTEEGMTGYIWAVSSGGTIASGDGTSSITILWTANGLQTITLNYTDVNGCTAVSPSSYNVSINTLPIPSLNGLSSVCTGSTTTYTSDIGMNNYSWTVSVGGSITAGGGPTDASVTVLWSTLGGQSVSVNYVNGTVCTAATPTVLNVTVHDLPTPAISGTAVLCAGTSGVVYGAQSGMTNYVWVVSAGGAITSGGGPASNTVTVTWNTPGPQTVSVNFNDVNGCTALAPTIYPLTVNPLPVPSVTGPASVCLNSTGTYYTEASMTNYVWTVSAGGIITSGSSTNSVNILWSTTGTKTITVNYNDANGCTAPSPSTYTVSVNILPVPALNGLNMICSGNSTTYTTDAGMNNYLWLISAGGTITAGGGPSDNTVTVTWNTAGAQTVSVNFTMGTGCTSASPTVLNVNVKPMPSVTNAANSTICSSVTTNISLLASLPLTTFTWTATGSSGNVQGQSNSGGPVISQTLINSGFNTETVDYSVTPSLNGCDGSVAHYIVTVDPVSDAYFNPNGQTFCSGGTSSISILSHVAGATFTWTGIGSSGNISGFGPGVTSSIAQALTNIGTGPGTVTYSISPSFNNCPGTPNSVVVTVNPLPSVTYTICNDVITTTAAQPFKLKGGLPLGGTYSGAGVNIGIFYPSIAGMGNQTITYSYSNTWGCVANATQVISVINPPVFLCENTMTDIRDNMQYPTVKIGTQCWMAENLDYGTFIASTQMQRDNCISEKYCFSDNLANCTSYGGLYQWDELMQYDNAAATQGFCPPGWHVPTENEWNTLFNFYISNGFAGSPLKYTGYSGFNAFLSGTRFNNANWNFSNFAVMFWSSTKEGNDKAWAHGMNTFNPSVSYYPSSRTHAFNLRCIKD